MIGTSVFVDFSSGCPLDPAAIDFVPTSPSLSTNRPAYSVHPLTWLVTSGTWKPSTFSGTDVKGKAFVQSTFPSNYNLEWWLYHTSDLLLVRNQSNFSYKFTFELHMNNTELNILEVKIALFTKIHGEIPRSAGTNSTYVLDYQPSTQRATEDSWIEYSGIVSSSVLQTRIPAGAYVKTSSLNGKVTLVQFRNLRIEVQPSAIEQPMLVSGSELVTLRRPTAELDPNPRTDCPHLQPKLVVVARWCNLGRQYSITKFDYHCPTVQQGSHYLLLFERRRLRENSSTC
jgi:hypothetical protein